MLVALYWFNIIINNVYHLLNKFKIEIEHFYVIQVSLHQQGRAFLLFSRLQRSILEILL